MTAVNDHYINNQGHHHIVIHAPDGDEGTVTLLKANGERHDYPDFGDGSRYGLRKVVFQHGFWTFEKGIAEVEVFAMRQARKKAIDKFLNEYFHYRPDSTEYVLKWASIGEEDIRRFMREL